MKNIDYKNIKRINSYTNLPKFDIGKRVNLFSSGYLAGEQVDTSLFSSTPSQSFLPLADSIRSTIAPTAITGATNFLTQAATTALNVPSIASAFGIKSAGTAATSAASTAASAGSAAGSTAAGTAGAAAGTTSSAAGAISALAPVMAIGGLTQGGIGLANAISSFSDPVVSSSDALNSMGKSTLTKYGEAYTTYTGLDRKSIENVIDQANKAGKTNLTMSGATTGGSAGALIGLAGGPVGSLIGFGIGSLIGAIASWFGGESAAEKRRKRIERMIDNTLYATNNYNMNEEAESASRGMRRIFSQDHAEYADKGKDVNTDFGKPGKIKMVHTSKGIQPGVELGIGGGDETIFNPTTGEASVIEEGKKRVDNISVGTPITSKNAKREWDDTVILGNTVNPETGNLISEDAKPYAKVLENSKKQTPMTNIGKKTQELNERNAIAALLHLADIQQLNHAVEEYKYNCGKLAKYYIGKPTLGDAKKTITKISWPYMPPEEPEEPNKWVAPGLGGKKFDNGILLPPAPKLTPPQRPIPAQPRNRLAPGTTPTQGLNPSQLKPLPQVKEPNYSKNRARTKDNAPIEYTGDTRSGKFLNRFNGIGDYVMTIIPHLGQLGMLLSDNTDYTPRSYNPFVASNYGRYVDNMRSRRLNPAQALKNAELANAQNRYATTHQGGLSAGQIAALSSMSNLATANAKNNILADYALKNIALANEADRIGVQAAMSEAARQQQGNTNWYEWLMRSGSAANNLKQSYKKAMYDQIAAIGKDILSMYQYKQAKKFKNDIIGMFNLGFDPFTYNQLVKSANLE